jgi:uncharacterized protein
MRLAATIAAVSFLVACPKMEMESRPDENLDWACGRGEAEACTELGKREYQYKDWPVAAELYQKGCDGGDAAGCCRLGEMQWGAKGIPKDLIQAEKNQRKACTLEDAKCCDNVGLMYATNLVEGKDYDDAQPFFETACESGHNRGCYNIGLMYHQGHGSVEKDESKAAPLYHTACDGGFKMACYNLAILYQHGQGVEKDDFKAYEYFDRGCNYHNKRSCQNAETYKQVTDCHRACEHADGLVQAYLSSGNKDTSENMARVERLHPHCHERCMVDVVDMACVHKATSAAALGPCDPP